MYCHINASFNDEFYKRGIKTYLLRLFPVKKELQKGIVEIKIKRDIKDVLSYIVDKILEIFERYTEGYTRNIYISRWI